MCGGVGGGLTSASFASLPLTYLILFFFNILSFPVSLNKTKERADIVLTIFIDLLPYKRNSIHSARETPADDVDET